MNHKYLKIGSLVQCLKGTFRARRLPKPKVNAIFVLNGSERYWLATCIGSFQKQIREVLQNIRNDLIIAILKMNAKVIF